MNYISMVKHPLVDAWRHCSLLRPPYCLSEDKDIIGSKAKQVDYFSFREFIDSDDFGQASGKFHLGLLPQPFIGNLERASVFVTMLNPGFSPGDYYAIERNKEFRQAVERNIHQENQDDDYPFFYLNPSFSWTPGGVWWQNKFRSIAHYLITEGVCKNYQSAFRHISQNMACLELFPYYSTHFSQPKFELKSTALLMSFVQNLVVPTANKNKALLIVTRKIDLWKLSATDNIVLYTGGQSRAASLGVDSESPGGKKIAQWLKHNCAIPHT